MVSPDEDEAAGCEAVESATRAWPLLLLAMLVAAVGGTPPRGVEMDAGVAAPPAMLCMAAAICRPMSSDRVLRLEASCWTVRSNTATRSGGVDVVTDVEPAAGCSEDAARDTREPQGTSAGLPRAISTRAPAATLVMTGPL